MRRVHRGHPRPRRHATAVLLAALLGSAASPGAQAPTLRARIVAAEDARVTTAVAIAPILEGLRSADTSIAAQAARALGRLEEPAFARYLVPLLADRRVEVRRQAVNALGQSVARRRDPAGSPSREVATVTRELLARLAIDSDPSVRGVMAETLGRLPHGAADRSRVEAQLAAVLPDASDRTTPSGPADVAVRAGAVKGLEAIIRLAAPSYVPDPRTVDRLKAAATRVVEPANADLAAIRRLAWAALRRTQIIDASMIAGGLDDPDAQVRRLAIGALTASVGATAARGQLLGHALVDPSASVRYEAVVAYARVEPNGACGPIQHALDDPDDHVVLAAIDALGRSCPDGVDAAPALATIANALPPPPAADAVVAWHRPAHAIVALAKARREAAIPRLVRFADYPVWEVRMYAARAAAVLADSAALDRLARDPDDNVRNEALLGLQQVRGHEADDEYLAALGRHDYQLVRTAARVLEGTARRDAAASALTTAFLRVTAERRETSRDARLALLERLREVGSRVQAPALGTCVRDFDPVIARTCAETIGGWTGTTPAIDPQRLPQIPVLTDLPDRARITLDGGRVFDLRLFPDAAPATVSRFVRLAREGYYNGLMFQRVAPNFVIQGGGPGANEYSGAPRFMRDELGLLHHRRGRVGISTRGRDTGDAQVFINLMDNPRLDHEYTVFAEVSRGMAVVDGVIEGTRIVRIEVP